MNKPALSIPLRLRPAWRTYILNLTASIGFLSLAIYIGLDQWSSPVLQEALVYWLNGLSLLAAGPALYWRYSHLYLLEDGRVTSRKGVFSVSTTTVMLRDVRSVNMTQSLVGRIFDVGTLTFNTAAADEPDVLFNDIHTPKAVMRIAQQCISTPEKTTTD